jgi:hypothetical protein
MERDGILAIVLDRIDKATGEMRDDVSRIKTDIATLVTTSVRQQGILEDQLRRTEAVEKSVKFLEGRITPLEQHTAMWSGAGKVLAILGGLAALVVAILAIYKAVH